MHILYTSLPLDFGISPFFKIKDIIEFKDDADELATI